MSEWDRKYHRQKQSKLKATLVTIAVVVAIFVGITVAEHISYAMTFPGRSESIEIDGNIFYINVDWYSSIYKHSIRLVTDTNEGDSFPDGVNATQIWVIPLRGRIWSWRDYKIYPLTFSSDSSSFSEYHTGCGFTLYEYDLIVEVNASGSRLFYLYKEGIYL